MASAESYLPSAKRSCPSGPPLWIAHMMAGLRQAILFATRTKHFQGLPTGISTENTKSGCPQSGANLRLHHFILRRPSEVPAFSWIELSCLEVADSSRLLVHSFFFCHFQPKNHMSSPQTT